MAKMFATEAAQRVIDRAVQLHGGRGVTKGDKVEELYREIRALRIYEGATEVQKIVIAREVLKQRAGEARAGGGMMEHGHDPDRDMSIRSRGTICRRASSGRSSGSTLPELQYPERLNCVTEFVDRWVAAGRGRPHRVCLAHRDADLRAACRAHQPHRQCADARSRPGAGQPRAAARAEQSDDGRGLSRGHQGRRRRGRHHAAAARQGAVLSARQGEDRARAVRRAARRRDGEGQGRSRAELQARRLLGQRRADALEDADGASPATRISPPATPRATMSA